MGFLKKIILVILINTIPLFPNEWQVSKKSENKVVFHSSTNLLDFQGETAIIDGYIYWEGDKIFGDKNEVYFEVQLATFKTGIGKRDSDMREDVLHTDLFPISSFKGNFTKVEKSGPNYNVIIKGEMTLHGYSKEMEISGIITIKDEAMNINSKFSIFLKDYNIEAPSLVSFIKVAEEIKLELDFNLNEVK